MVGNNQRRAATPRDASPTSNAIGKMIPRKVQRDRQKAHGPAPKRRDGPAPDAQHREGCQREAKPRKAEDRLITGARSVKEPDQPSADQRGNHVRQKRRDSPQPEIARDVAQLRYRIHRQSPSARDNAAEADSKKYGEGKHPAQRRGQRKSDRGDGHCRDGERGDDLSRHAIREQPEIQARGDGARDRGKRVQRRPEGRVADLLYVAKEKQDERLEHGQSKEYQRARRKDNEKIVPVAYVRVLLVIVDAFTDSKQRKASDRHDYRRRQKRQARIGHRSG